MNKLLYGNIVKDKMLEELKEEVEQFKDKPILSIVQVGDSEASNRYIKNKIKACEKVGIKVNHLLCHPEASQSFMLSLIDELNKGYSSGIIVQLPLPKHLDAVEIGERILPEKDVDGFNSVNVGKTLLGIDSMVSCTPLGIMKIFEHYNIELKGKNVCIVGRSNIVGKPMASLLINAGATVTICNSHTKGIIDKTKKASIVILATGQAKHFNRHYFSNGQIIVDVGINFDENGKICGDADKEDIINNMDSVYLVPSPNGVGQTTVASLIYNTVKAYKNKR